MIVSVAPLVLTFYYGRGLDAPLGVALSDLPPHELALMAVASVAGWLGAQRIGLFGASIIGPMIFAALFSLSGLIEHRPPALAIMAAQFFIGCAIGAKYTGVTWQELRHDIASGAVFCLILCVLAFGFAEVVYRAGWAPGMEALLSFAPGGQGEMAVLAIVASADLAFVVTHHVVRIVVVILGAPLIARLLRW
ncbi:MAG: membrane AbrB-like protein [Limimaricola cinnabarinus]|jgi:membrane AbrB-like protein|uniref:AbrB family transcriptional regulator n=1 Tax=Limimaricola cinnabarinus TaxID=1125964 RepID=UPI0039E271DC